MVRIIKNQANVVVFTLKEKQTITAPDFLFKFVNDQDGTTKLFTAEDISLYPDRYNEFTITDDAIEDEYNGTMDFSPPGYWSYTVYEMTAGSPNDLDPDNALGVLEVGKAEVVDESASTDVSFDEDDNIDNVSFNEPD